MQIELTTVTKFISFVCGIVIIIMSIDRFTSLDVSKPRQFILTVHFILLGSILVLSEFGIGYIVNNFGMVKSLFGRGIYAFFLGTIMLTDKSQVFQLIVALILIGIGLIYLCLGCKEKKYDPVSNPNAVPSSQPSIK